MVKPFSLNHLRRSGGGLLLISLGLHGLVLAMPTTQGSAPTEELMTLVPPGSSADAPTPAETIQVMRLPTANTNQTPPQDTSARSAAQTVPLPKPPARPTPAPSSAAPSPEPAPAPKPEATPAPESRPETPPTSAVAPPEPEPEPEPTPEPTPPGLVYNNKTANLTTDTRDFLDWYTDQDWNAFDLAPLPGPKDLAVLRVPYEGTVCLPVPPAPGRLEVIVGSDGQLQRPPRLLATTGYDDLDAAVLDFAAQQAYTEAANPGLPNPTVYWLPMEVTYQGPACPVS